MTVRGDLTVLRIRHDAPTVHAAQRNEHSTARFENCRAGATFSPLWPKRDYTNSGLRQPPISKCCENFVEWIRGVRPASPRPDRFSAVQGNGAMSDKAANDERIALVTGASRASDAPRRWRSPPRAPM